MRRAVTQKITNYNCITNMENLNVIITQINILKNAKTLSVPEGFAAGAQGGDKHTDNSQIHNYQRG